jgi:RNA polymerase sigma factor (sigma-70 family)
MNIEAENRSLQQVARDLPFHIDNTGEANAAFGRWREKGYEEDRRLVALWTYCYVRRYFLVKLAREADGPVSDLDALVDQAYIKIGSRHSAVRQPESYASWVSVVCKRTFINYIRGPQRVIPLAEKIASLLPADVSRAQEDTGLLNHALKTAVRRLPPFLQNVAQLYFIERCSQEEIGLTTGHPAPTVRTYISKAVARFRRDPHLLAVREEIYEYES